MESADPLSSSKILNGGGTTCLVFRPSQIGLWWHADVLKSYLGLGQGERLGSSHSTLGQRPRVWSRSFLTKQSYSMLGVGVKCR